MLKGFFISVAIILIWIPVFSQVPPVVHVSFDSCTAVDEGTLGSSIAVAGEPECVCGLTGESFYFDGERDGLAFDGKVNPLFDKDFTLEFYFSVYNMHNITDLLSFKNKCVSDSSFSLQYLPTIKELRFLVKGPGHSSIEIDVKVDDSKCWHHLAIIRQEYEFYLFLDGKIAGQGHADREYFFAKDNVLAIAGNPCLEEPGSNFRRFKGRIDEFKIYDRALTGLQLSQTEIPADRILNRDTTIFLGSSIQIKMGPTCADNFTWSHPDDLDDPHSLTPVITPKKSTKYLLFLLMDGKACADSIFIHVQDKDSLDCSKLLLPSAFTPNGDGLNDVFYISNKFIIEKLDFFDIFDRTGSRVFHTTDINEGWDGNYKNSKLNPAKFVYKVRYTCNEKEYTKQGIVNLLR